MHWDSYSKGKEILKIKTSRYKIRITSGGSGGGAPDVGEFLNFYVNFKLKFEIWDPSYFDHSQI